MTTPENLHIIKKLRQSSARTFAGFNRLIEDFASVECIATACNALIAHTLQQIESTGFPQPKGFDIYISIVVQISEIIRTGEVYDSEGYRDELFETLRNREEYDESAYIELDIAILNLVRYLSVASGIIPRKENAHGLEWFMSYDANVLAEVLRLPPAQAENYVISFIKTAMINSLL